MPPAAPPPADAGAPRVELSRVANGNRTGRIVAVATDASAEALAAAKTAATEIDAELAARYDEA